MLFEAVVELGADVINFEFQSQMNRLLLDILDLQILCSRNAHFMVASFSAGRLYLAAAVPGGFQHCPFISCIIECNCGY